MILKRIDSLGNKSYINAFTGYKVEIKYVGHKEKIKQGPSTSDAKRIEEMRKEGAYCQREYKKRLTAYRLRNS